jgi:rhodanese-related sulfurtransferase
MPKLHFEIIRFMMEIESRKAWDLLKNDKDAIIVDVRHKEEWDEERIDIRPINKSARLVTISNDFDSFMSQLEDALPSKKSPILFFCRSGARSKIAAALAEKHGYESSYNVTGGIIKWIENGLPHSTGEKNA